MSMGEVDIAIVGGGAAGIAAARTIAAAGRSALMIEAGNRLGGRAWTAVHDGMPLDLGCEWLHSADRNPLVALAEAAGLTVDRSTSNWRVQYRELGFSEAEQEAAVAASEAFHRRLHEQPPASDRASDALPPGGRWNGWLDAISGYVNGAPFAEVSVADYLAYDDAATDENWRVREGYGALIAGAMTPAVPTRLQTAVRGINLGGSGVRLETHAGTLAARACIVTVSTAVLAGGQIRLPAAADEHRHAAARLPLGLANKLFFRMDDPEAGEVNAHLIGATDRGETGSYMIRPLGRPVVECFFGGSGARALEAAGTEAAFAFAREELGALMGSDFVRRLRPLAESRWGADPLFGGSYSHARPGHADARAMLARPVEERLFFAGEACSATDFTAVHGAWETGIAAARQAIAALG